MKTQLNPELLTATLVSPFIGFALGASATIAINALTHPMPISLDSLSGLLVYLIIYTLYGGATVGLASMLLFGIPCHSALRRLGWRNVVAYAAAGGLIGVVTDTVTMGVVSLFRCGNCVDAMYQTAPFAAIVGISTAVTFWLIRRPDRITTNPASTAS